MAEPNDLERLADSIARRLAGSGIGEVKPEYVRKLNLSTLVRAITRGEISLAAVENKLARYVDPSSDPKVPDPAIKHIKLIDLKGRIEMNLEVLYEELDRRENHYRSEGR